jgi:hypothetical protein
MAGSAPYLPLGLEPKPPTFVLFISKSLAISRYYLLFDYTLFRAGNTLKEIFNGMRDFRGTPSSSEPEWKAEDPCSDYGDIEAYFPHYVHHPGHGNWCLAWQIPELPDEISTNGADFINQITMCN